MKDDVTKKTNQSDKNDHAAGKVEELSQNSISDQDAQAVKGGMAGDLQKVMKK